MKLEIPFLYPSKRRPPKVVLQYLNNVLEIYTVSFINGVNPFWLFESRLQPLKGERRQIRAYEGSCIQIRRQQLQAEVNVVVYDHPEFVMRQKYSAEMFGLTLLSVQEEWPAERIEVVRTRMHQIFQAFELGRLHLEHLAEPWYKISWLNQLNPRDRSVIVRLAINPLRSLAAHSYLCQGCNCRQLTHFLHPTQERICDKCAQFLKNEELSQ